MLNAACMRLQYCLHATRHNCLVLLMHAHALTTDTPQTTTTLSCSVTVRDSPAALAATEGLSTVITVLPDRDALTAVFLGPDGLLAAPGGPKPSLFINVSTVDPETIQQLAQRVAATKLAPGAPAPQTVSGGCVLIDAPATGGVVGAESGSLCFCVGAGERRDADAAAAVLKLLGSHITYCGPVGAGSVAKLVSWLCCCLGGGEADEWRQPREGSRLVVAGRRGVELVVAVMSCGEGCRRRVVFIVRCCLACCLGA